MWHLKKLYYSIYRLYHIQTIVVTTATSYKLTPRGKPHPVDLDNIKNIILGAATMADRARSLSNNLGGIALHA